MNTFPQGANKYGIVIESVRTFSDMSKAEFKQKSMKKKFPVNTPVIDIKPFKKDIVVDGKTALREFCKDREAHRTLEKIIVANAQGYLPDVFYDITNPKILDLKSSALDHISIKIANLSGLTMLNLSKNFLKTLPKELASLSKLKKLVLDGNKFREIPSCVCKLPQLYELYISDNHVVKFPEELSNLKTLAKIYINNNKLSEFPKEVLELPLMESLGLDNNDIKSIPSKIGELKKLRRFSLVGNNVKHIPDEIGELSTLKFFDMGKNLVNYIPPTIAKCKRLNELRLNDNKLNTIPLEFPTMTKLEKLWLSNNPLTYLPPSLDKLNLKVLYVEEKWSRAFKSVISLTCVAEEIEAAATSTKNKLIQMGRDLAAKEQLKEKAKKLQLDVEPAITLDVAKDLIKQHKNRKPVKEELNTNPTGVIDFNNMPQMQPMAPVPNNLRMHDSNNVHITSAEPMVQMPPPESMVQMPPPEPMVQMPPPEPMVQMPPPSMTSPPMSSPAMPSHAPYTYMNGWGIMQPPYMNQPEEMVYNIYNPVPPMFAPPPQLPQTQMTPPEMNTPNVMHNPMMQNEHPVVFANKTEIPKSSQMVNSFLEDIKNYYDGIIADKKECIFKLNRSLQENKLQIRVLDDENCYLREQAKEASDAAEKANAKAEEFRLESEKLRAEIEKMKRAAREAKEKVSADSKSKTKSRKHTKRANEDQARALFGSEITILQKAIFNEGQAKKALRTKMMKMALESQQNAIKCMNMKRTIYQLQEEVTKAKEDTGKAELNAKQAALIFAVDKQLATEQKEQVQEKNVAICRESKVQLYGEAFYEEHGAYYPVYIMQQTQDQDFKVIFLNFKGNARERTLKPEYVRFAYKDNSKSIPEQQETRLEPFTDIIREPSMGLSSNSSDKSDC